MPELFTEVSDQQQELIAGGAFALMPFETVSNHSVPSTESEPGPTPFPNDQTQQYPLSPDPRHNQASCPACGMG